MGSLLSRMAHSELNLTMERLNRFLHDFNEVSDAPPPPRDDTGLGAPDPDSDSLAAAGEQTEGAAAAWGAIVPHTAIQRCAWHWRPLWASCMLAERPLAARGRVL